MFCTAFLSEPPEQLSEGCLVPLHCLVLPEEELCMPLSNSGSRLWLCRGGGACVAMGRILLDVNLAAALGSDCQSSYTGHVPKVRGRCGKSPLSDRRAAASAIPECADQSAGPTLPMATVDSHSPDTNNVRLHSHPQARRLQTERKTKGKRKKLTKADIENPRNFLHIGHVGWDPNTGFDLKNLDTELKNLFDMCGISEAQLKDKETSKVISDFIEKEVGEEVVKKAPAPPQSRGVPPLSPAPPSSGQPPRPPTELRGGTPPPPSRVPPPSQNSFISVGPSPAPTPPGPPLLTNVEGLEPPSPTGGKRALLDQIREGTHLKKVEQNSRPGSSTGRDALLNQIRQGIQLKTPSSSSTSDTKRLSHRQVSDGLDPVLLSTAGIVGALMEVMQKRSKAIHPSDEDEDEDGKDFEDEDEWAD